MVLGQEPLSSPTYYIIAGSEPNEGAVLTRDRNTLLNLWSLNVTKPVAHNWYLLETNYVRMLASGDLSYWCDSSYTLARILPALHESLAT